MQCNVQSSLAKDNEICIYSFVTTLTLLSREAYSITLIGKMALERILAVVGERLVLFVKFGVQYA